MEENKQIMEIEFPCGCDIQRAYQYLREAETEHHILVKGDFNGRTITSAMTLDDCYREIVGMSKADYDAKLKKKAEEYEREEEEHKAKIPQLCAEAEKRAIGLVREDKMDFFKEVLPIRFGDLYRGMEVGATLDLIEILVKNKDDKEVAIEEARKKFDEQGHSGASAGLVASMVRTFSQELGDEFFEKVYKRV